MANTQEKVVQYLNEARATELALIQTLEAHIAMTPRGAYRDVLENHLHETRDHAERVRRRLDELGEGMSAVQAVVGTLEGVAGRVVALAKGPLDLVRGTSGEEKLLKNAKDEIASEQLEIATYHALEQVAETVGDGRTAKLAADIRAQEERARDTLMGMLGDLAQAALAAEAGEGSYDIAVTGAADAARSTAQETRRTARKAGRQAKRQAQGASRRSAARAKRTSDAAASRAQSAASKAAGAAGEAASSAAGSVQEAAGEVDRKATGGDEPWRGYDEATVEEIDKRLRRGGPELATRVRDYERRHKERTGVLEAAERERDGAGKS